LRHHRHHYHRARGDDNIESRAPGRPLPKTRKRLFFVIIFDTIEPPDVGAIAVSGTLQGRQSVTILRQRA